MDDLYEEMRLLSVELLRLNIDQYDGKYSKKEVEEKLTNLANKHIDLDSEIFQCQKILTNDRNQSLEKNK